MTIREMEIFLALVEHKTMRKTAEEIFISQPTISAVISSIEKQLDTKLFERLGKRLVITQSGEKLFSYVKKILDLQKEMYDEISNDSRNVRLKIGATISVGGKLLNSILKKWDYSMPFVTVTNTHEIEHKIISSELDVAIVEGKIQSHEIICEPMFKDKMYLYCSLEHEKIKENSISIKNLEGENFILREEGSGTRDMTLAMLKKHDVNITQLWNANTMDSIFEAVQNNFGVTVASEKLFDESLTLPENKLRKVDIIDCDFTRTFHFVYHKDKYKNRMFCEFKSLCESMADFD